MRSSPSPYTEETKYTLYHAKPPSKPHASLARRQTQSDGVALDFGRASTETAVIIIILIIFGVLLLALFVLYKKKGSAALNPLSWLRSGGGDKSVDGRTGDGAADPNALGYNEKLNDSQDTLVEGSTGPSRSVKPPEAGDVDIEKGPVEDGFDNSGLQAAQMLQSPTGQSIQTRSSMALNPHHIGKLRSGNEALNASTPDQATFSPAAAYEKESDLPPLPSNRDTYRDTSRDTMLTTISEDSEPVRHRTVNSWVSNMQTRQERRQAHNQQDASITAGTVKGQIEGDDASTMSSRVSELSGMDTPSVRTAQLARAMPHGPARVELAAPSSSTQNINDDSVRVHNHNIPSKEYDGNMPENASATGSAGHVPGREAPYPDSEAASFNADYSEQAPEQPDPDAEYKREGYAAAEMPQFDDYRQQAQSQHGLPSHPRIQVHSPTSSLSSTIPEEDFIPNVSRYKRDSDSTLSRSSSNATAVVPPLSMVEEEEEEEEEEGQTAIPQQQPEPKPDPAPARAPVRIPTSLRPRGRGRASPDATRRGVDRGRGPLPAPSSSTEGRRNATANATQETAAARTGTARAPASRMTQKSNRGRKR